MKLESLRELFIEELQDLYSAENQILEALPKVIEKVTSPELKAGFTEHLAQTRGQVRRLDQIFDQLAAPSAWSIMKSPPTAPSAIMPNSWGAMNGYNSWTKH